MGLFGYYFICFEREMVGPLFLGGPRPPPARKKIYFNKKGRGRSRRERDTGQHNDANNNEATGSNGSQRWGVKAHDGFEPVNKK